MLGGSLQCKRSFVIGVLAFFASASYAQEVATADPGEQVFQATCFACHTIGGGRLVGPDLAGVAAIKGKATVLELIDQAESMRNAG